MKKISLYLFIGASLGEILSEIIGLQYLHQVCKPLIMITLGIYYFCHAEFRSTAVWLAIFFSLAGDVLLMFEAGNPKFFMIGTSSLFNSAYFLHLIVSSASGQIPGKVFKGHSKNPILFSHCPCWYRVDCSSLSFIGFIKNTGSGVRLSADCNGTQFVFRYGRTSNVSFGLVFLGSILFMFSDSVLAINKFFKPVPAAGFWIMSTYILAQFLIIHGLVKHVSNSK